MNRVSIFGFTGSIGTQALSVIEKYPSKFELDVLVCNQNIRLAVELIKKHNPKQGLQKSNPKPGIQNQESRRRNPKRGIQNQESKTKNPKQ